MTTQVCEVWQDNRSGQAGRMIGNLVLSHLCGDEITRMKGTMFSTPTEVIVGRVCSSSGYLLGGARHFCNVSKAQHRACERAAGNKPLMYLFITADPEHHVIDFWKLPGKIVKEVLARLKTKQSDKSCLLRVRKDGQKYVLNGDKDITRHHTQIPMAKGDERRISEAMKTEFERPPRDMRLVTESPRKRQVFATISGQRWQGVMTPSRR